MSLRVIVVHTETSQRDEHLVEDGNYWLGADAPCHIAAAQVSPEGASDVHLLVVVGQLPAERPTRPLVREARPEEGP